MAAPRGRLETPPPDEPRAEQPPPSPIVAGERLAGRYRLVRALPAAGPGAGPATVWQAVDEVLARSVAVTVLPARDEAEAEPFLEAAARTGPVVAPGLARTLDASLEQRPGGIAAYVISEWVEGRSLGELLREQGPLPADAAVELARQGAEALREVHAAGLVHGRVTPGALLLAGDGRLRLTGTALAPALCGDTPLEGPEGVAADTRGLAGCLYALLTGRWPGAPERAAGLPPAPLSGSRALSPRQVRAGVPREVDAVVARALLPGTALDTPQALTEALEQALRPAGPHPRAHVVPRLRRALPWVLAAVVLVGAGTAGWVTGLRVGRVEPAQDAFAGLPPEPAPSSSGAGRARPQAVDLRRLAVRAFDPQGDGEEQDGEVANAFDGDDATAWRTDSYRTAAFGGLKPGVGLLVDLEQEAALRGVQVAFRRPGVSVELRAGADPAAGVEALAVVASSAAAGPAVELTPRAGASARFWLVWLTGLPAQGEGFRGEVAELVLLR